jgi:hypothetical protein
LCAHSLPLLLVAIHHHHRQVENYPLYAMVGIACGLAAYTPIRHLTNAADIA